ncbi:hypothetical protein [Ignavibacterium sp.]|uniref:hypothetical protein n=1 Tax=Ignavibacterium sp. TaxID=2651167 RepID=UPI00307E4545
MKKTKSVSYKKSENEEADLKKMYKREKLMTAAIYTLIIVSTIAIVLIAFILLFNQQNKNNKQLKEHLNESKNLLFNFVFPFLLCR